MRFVEDRLEEIRRISVCQSGVDFSIPNTKFYSLLKRGLESGNETFASFFCGPDQITRKADDIVSQLRAWGEDNVHRAVIGLSGGADSALTCLLLLEAGYEVYGYSLPIHQNPEELSRAQRFAKLVSEEFEGFHFSEVDLTEAFEATKGTLTSGAESPNSIRMGNIRARLRMTFLYDAANGHKAVVASTDNLSELATGFWTLHGDVGDISPIQMLNKSYEVPMMVTTYFPRYAEFGLAKPTDGLGISGSDEDQFGFSYLDLDIILANAEAGISWIQEEEEDSVFAGQYGRISDAINARSFKRNNPVIFYPKEDGDRSAIIRKLEYPKFTKKRR
jgi:nicotinamide-nucleotide amidase